MIVGAVTLLFGAIIGCAKDDIKKALAASTMSQIGYMVLAAGLGPGRLRGRDHAPADPRLLQGRAVPRRRFGHARAWTTKPTCAATAACAHCCPITFVTFGLGYLAIIGVPPFAGFFSKDAIIETAFAAGGVRGWLLGGAALLGAGITAFYMTRVMLMTFFGEKRWKPDTHPHESPAVDDAADDRARRRLGRRRRAAGHRRHPGALARTGRRQPRSRTTPSRSGC